MLPAVTRTTLAALAVGVCVVACTVFGGENDTGSGTPEPEVDAAAPDGASTFDGSKRPNCPAACDVDCDGAGVCPPFDFAPSLTGKMGAVFALHIDDAGLLYIGNRQAADGGIMTCAVDNARGATCTPLTTFPRNDLVSMHVGDRLYWATSRATEFGSADLGGGDVRTATSTFTAKAVVGDQNVIVGLDASLFFCPAQAGFSCVLDPNIASAAAVGGFKGDYCAAVKRTGAFSSTIECASTAAGGVQRKIADDADAQGTVVLTEKLVFWRSGVAVLSAPRLPGPASLALPVTLFDVGPGPFTADGDTIYYAAGNAILYAPRSGAAAAVKITTAKAAVTAIALSPRFVYFAYGNGATSGISRVPR